MNITWISGKCGYGKTKLAYSLIRDFEKENKKTCKLDCRDFVDILVRNLINKIPLDNMVHYFQKYDLLVLDDVDLSLSGKRVTQKEIKWMIQKICTNNRTKIILITQKRARKLKILKFNSRDCFYLRLKTPSNDLKRNLFREWLEKENFIVPPEKIEETIRKTDNLFQLKGLLNQISFTVKKLKN